MVVESMKQVQVMKKLPKTEQHLSIAMLQTTLVKFFRGLRILENSIKSVRLETKISTYSMSTQFQKFQQVKVIWIQSRTTQIT
jgi:hypothetical protein